MKSSKLLSCTVYSKTNEECKYPKLTSIPFKHAPSDIDPNQPSASTIEALWGNSSADPKAR